MNINLFCNELRKVLEDIREEILERKWLYGRYVVIKNVWVWQVGWFTW
jgi:hypothetical protein